LNKIEKSSTNKYNRIKRLKKKKKLGRSEILQKLNKVIQCKITQGSILVLTELKT